MEQLIGDAPVHHRGRSWKFRCPFLDHEDKDASFTVYSDGWKCYGCGRHGDAVSFLVQYQGMSYPQARRKVLGQIDNVPNVSRKRGMRVTAVLSPQPPPPEWREVFSPIVDLCAERVRTNAKPAWNELYSRGIGPQIWGKYKVGYNPRWLNIENLGLKLGAGIVLPAFVGNDLWSINVRNLDGFGPKYHRPEDANRGYKSDVLFGLQFVQPAGLLIVVESELDVLCIAQAFMLDLDISIVGLRSANNWPLLKHFDLFSGHDVLVAFDGDKAGRDAETEMHIRHPRCTYRCFPDGLDACKMVQKGYDLRAYLLTGELHGRDVDRTYCTVDLTYVAV